MTNNQPLPSIPQNWSALTFGQLTDVWTMKIRFGGHPDAARAAALLAVVLGADVKVARGKTDERTGEQTYLLSGGEPTATYTVTARQLAHMARQTMTWLDFPYGDPGEDAVKDEKGHVIKERREGKVGYVNPDWRDALNIGQETIEVSSFKRQVSGEPTATNATAKNLKPDARLCRLARPRTCQPETIVFALPQLALNNLTWEQYRSLQAIAPQLFQEGISDSQALALQAEFVAHCLVPEQPEQPSADRFHPDHDFRYDAARAEKSIAFWQRELADRPVLFHICFQAYQTAMHYYATAFPLLFNGDTGKQDPLRDALTGELGTINGIMKYMGYRLQREVWETNMPYVLEILNSMTKEAKEVEKMNAKIKKK